MAYPIDSRHRRASLWPILGIAVLATALRLLVIDRDALWLDEGYSWWDARQSFASLWSLVPQCDPHPPLYFALLHGWIALFGDGTIAIRALSSVLGVATVVVVYLAGRELDAARGRSDRLFGIGTFAALLFALTPFQIYFSIEARPYALLCFGAALLTLGVLKVVGSREGTASSERAAGETPSVRHRFLRRVSTSGCLLMVAGAVTVVWTNNTAVLLLGAVCAAFVGLWLFDSSTRKTMVPVIAAGAIVALLWAPDLPLLFSQMREVSEDFWIPAASLQGLTFELHYLVGLDSMVATWWIVLAMVVGLALIGRRVGWRFAVVLAALAILPVLFNVAISVFFKPILIARALIVATPAITLALAALAMLVKPRALRLAVAFCLLVLHVVASLAFMRADHVKEPWKAVVSHLATVARDDIVLVVPNEMALPLVHEAQVEKSRLRVRGVPADFPATGMRARYPSGKCAPSVIGQDLAPLMGGLHNESAVVLLTRRNNTYDPGEAIASALRGAGFGLQHDDVFQPGDLRVMRFSRAPITQ